MTLVIIYGSIVIEGGDRVLSIKEVAKILGVSNQTVRNYINSGNLEAVRINQRVIRIPKEKLNEFIERGNDNV